jgi:hypothetical protein
LIWRKVGGGDSDCAFVKKKFPGEKKVWNNELSWCNTPFFYCQSSGRSLRTFSRSHCKTSQWYAELTDWLPGLILCEFWRKLWACSWLCFPYISGWEQPGVQTGWPLLGEQSSWNHIKNTNLKSSVNKALRKKKSN